MTFIKIFKKMLRKDLTLQNQELDRPVPKRKKKSNWINGRSVKWKNHEILGLIAKTYRYLIDVSSEDKKKAKHIKKCVMKKKRKFQDYKACLETTQLENKKKNYKTIKLTSLALKRS